MQTLGNLENHADHDGFMLRLFGHYHAKDGWCDILEIAHTAFAMDETICNWQYLSAPSTGALFAAPIHSGPIQLQIWAPPKAIPPTHEYNLSPIAAGVLFTLCALRHELHYTQDIKLNFTCLWDFALTLPEAETIKTLFKS